MTGRWLFLLGGCLLLGACPGCGGSDYATCADALQHQITVYQDLIDTLESVRDPATMAAARPALKELAARSRQATERVAALRPSADLKERLEEDFAGRVQAKVRALQEEVRRLNALPGGPQFLQEVGFGR